ncbi:MAG: hypothetical protein COB12_12535 [Flavobacterium sp.]|nr:MAG: hypothetical protein COB12_12535 [Flavobacterium sp.]
MDELDRIILHMAICAYMPGNPTGKIWKMANKYRKSTKCKEVKRVMNKIRKSTQPIEPLKLLAGNLFN